MGSTGSRVPSGAVVVAIAAPADATPSHTASMRMTRASSGSALSFSAVNEVRPTTAPLANTGPPALPRGSLRSPSMAREVTRVTVPKETLVGRPGGMPSATTSCPLVSGVAGVSPQPSGTGLIDPIAAGSIHSTATSFSRSATSTRPLTLTVGPICTSTDGEVPTTWWLVATRPRASITKPEAGIVGVHRATMLSCQSMIASVAPEVLPAGPAEAAVIGPASALAVVNSSRTSWPATRVIVCRHWYSRPWNATG